MKILHFYSSNAPEMVSRYVKTLCEEMSSQLSNDIVTSPNEAIATLKERHYDLLHIHGCWQYGFYRAMRQAERLGTRIVVTPHGQLEPWVMKEGYWKEKLPKRLLFQHAIVSHAYAIIVQGKMEEECLSKLGWNSRTVIIRNSLITNTINAHDMAQQMQNVYRKIMDSNTLQLMTSNTRITLRQLLKVGITGDKRWLGESYVTITDPNQWRMLYCYVHHEQVADIVKRGLNILHMEAPDFDISKMPCFLPDGYEPSKTIEEAIGMQFATENDRLMATFRHLRRLALRRRLTLAHLAELDKELRYHDAAEDQLCDALKEHHLYVFARRIMQLAHVFTGLDEGLMPMPMLEDRQTRIMKKNIENHLKI